MIRNCAFVATLRTNELIIAVPSSAPCSRYGVTLVKEQIDGSMARTKDKRTASRLVVAEVFKF